MYEVELAAFAAVIAVYALISWRIEKFNITAPMVFVVAGMLFGSVHLTGATPNFEALLILGNITLAIVLFADASRINISLFRVNAALPGRLLVVGLPLTIAAGALIAALLFTGLTIWQAAIVGAILAPTDAGLGQPIVSSERVPVRIREALNVESGLNDGGPYRFSSCSLPLLPFRKGLNRRILYTSPCSRSVLALSLERLSEWWAGGCYAPLRAVGG